MRNTIDRDVFPLISGIRYPKQKSNSREHVNIPEKGMTYTSSSNMINLDGPLIQIFLGFLLSIIGCVILISVPEYSQVSYLLFLIARCSCRTCHDLSCR